MIRICKYPRPASLRMLAWRLAFGPASILDGLVETLTFGTFGTNLRLIASREAMLASIEAQKAKAR